MKRLLTASLALAFLPLCFGQSAAKSQEIAALKDKAAKLTKRVSEITAHTNLQDSDEGIKLLKEVVDELSEIRDRLKALEEGKAQTGKDIDALKKTTFNGYIQSQYFTTNKTGSSTANAFAIRRARLGLVSKIDPRATLRLSAEFAEGSSRMDTRLKDAILDYDLTPNFGVASRVSMGQMPLSLGFDLERSDADRELPERAIYNQTLFKGERSRGVIVRSSLSGHGEAGAGVFNSLTVDDPEQSGLAPGAGNRLSGIAYLRATGKNYRVGVSGLAGQRPAYTANSATSPQVNRWFAELDGELRLPSVKGVFLRGEAMMGHDRVPNATAAPTRVGTDMRGFQGQIGYDIDKSNQVNFRWDQFDPDRATGGNAINEYTFSYQHFLSPMAKLQIGQDFIRDESRTQKTYNQTTIRLQFRF